MAKTYARLDGEAGARGEGEVEGQGREEIIEVGEVFRRWEDGWSLLQTVFVSTLLPKPQDIARM